MDGDERATLAREAATAHHLVLRNHGLVTLGASPADAFLLMCDFERACRAQVLAQAGGARLTRIDPQVAEKLWRDDPCSGRAFASDLIWPELLKRLDREAPGYRD
jgi:ribulose-5-phosphate 4-epimerase/fuculose-1-phosphate aldolase